MTGPTYGGSPVRSLSLDQIEEELSRTERNLAGLRDGLKRAHAQSAAEAAALRDMGIRAKEIMNRPKTWRGGSKRSDSEELERLRAEIRTRSDAANRAVEAMKAQSLQARELEKRQQELSTRRAEMLNPRS